MSTHRAGHSWTCKATLLALREVATPPAAPHRKCLPHGGFPPCPCKFLSRILLRPALTHGPPRHHVPRPCHQESPRQGTGPPARDPCVPGAGYCVFTRVENLAVSWVPPSTMENFPAWKMALEDEVCPSVSPTPRAWLHEEQGWQWNPQDRPRWDPQRTEPPGIQGSHRGGTTGASAAGSKGPQAPWCACET